MIKQLKFSMKLIKYGYGFKLNLFAGILCFVLGLAMDITMTAAAGQTGFAGGLPYAGLLICLSGVFTVQIWHSLNVSEIILSSPRRKASLCSIPELILFSFILLGFTFIQLFHLILYQIIPCEPVFVVRLLYLQTLLLFVTLIYFVLCYRYFILFTILYFITYFATQGLSEGGLLFLQEFYPDSALFRFPVALAVCYLVLLAGMLLAHWLNARLYKKPIDKWAQGAALRRYL